MTKVEVPREEDASSGPSRGDASPTGTTIDATQSVGETKIRCRESPWPEDMPAWSPDGNWIAFQRFVDTTYRLEIFVMRADFSDEARLTYNVAEDWGPVWNPEQEVKPPLEATTIPTKTPTPITCAQEPQGEFVDSGIWSEYRNRLGCPKQIQPIYYGKLAEQLFDHGFMFWSDQINLPDGLVLVVRDDQRTWYVLRDWSWVEESAVCAADYPGRLVPKNAFGGVWCDNKAIREALGFPTAPEASIGAAVQQFENGFVLRVDDPKHRFFYVLLREGLTRSYVLEPRP